jgi:Lon protease-like protein
MQLPLFPLRTVLFPGGLLPLKVFEQRYVAMTKECARDGTPFGVCLITRGEEVAQPSAPAAQFARVGTLATIDAWDSPELGILHVASTGGERFEVLSHAVRADGLVVAEVSPIPAEPTAALPPADAPLVRFLEVVASRVGPRHFPATHAWNDATWVGYRLAELLPLPLPIKQSMLEINDPVGRLAMLRKFLAGEGFLQD